MTLIYVNVIMNIAVLRDDNQSALSQNFYMYNYSWYQSLSKPPLAPPDWVFAPAWLILYITILAAFIVYSRKSSKDKKFGYVCFWSQLALNFSWSPIFFGAKRMLVALVVIILLDIFLFLTIKSFYKISKPAALLLLPYFIWVIFATYLNFEYWRLN